MSGNCRQKDVSLRLRDLARLMPLHVLLDASGRIEAMGPTLERVASGLDGRSFFECFEVRPSVHFWNIATLGLSSWCEVSVRMMLGNDLLRIVLEF